MCSKLTLLLRYGAPTPSIRSFFQSCRSNSSFFSFPINDRIVFLTEQTLVLRTQNLDRDSDEPRHWNLFSDLGRPRENNPLFYSPPWSVRGSGGRRDHKTLVDTASIEDEGECGFSHFVGLLFRIRTQLQGTLRGRDRKRL